MVLWTLACRFWTSTTPSAFESVERFDKGMESALHAEFWTRIAPTRNGTAARTKVGGKYILKKENDKRDSDSGYQVRMTFEAG